MVQCYVAHPTERPIAPEPRSRLERWQTPFDLCFHWLTKVVARLTSTPLCSGGRNGGLEGIHVSLQVNNTGRCGKVPGENMANGEDTELQEIDVTNLIEIKGYLYTSRLNEVKTSECQINTVYYPGDRVFHVQNRRQTVPNRQPS